jgi:succinate dehydrogenase / fumarate reductase cytochrome b subunit
MGADSRNVYAADRWHSLAGVFAACAAICSLHAHSAILLGADAYHAAMVGGGDWLRDADLVLLIEVVLFGFALTHYGVYGFASWWRRGVALPASGTFREWMYTIQGWTGVYLIAYVGHHLVRVWAVVHFEWGGASSGPSPLLDGSIVSLAQHVAAIASAGPFAIGFQALGIFALAFHVSHGLWNFGVNWGVTSGPKAMARSTVACAAVFGVVFVIGMETLAAFVSLGTGGGA